MKAKPIINEIFSDNGEHSHWEVICPLSGALLWEEQAHEFECTECAYGEYIQQYYHQPDGAVHYECNICKHKVSFQQSIQSINW